MCRCFAGVRVQGASMAENTAGINKVDVSGGEGRVWFSWKRVKGMMAMWEEEGEMDKGTGLGGFRNGWMEKQDITTEYIRVLYSMLHILSSHE
ncbi:hypothetical protein AXF42_Ash018823 [Apostasia shenzhenica]|uniref:Uncharacterized protein n=1 Tax=Apostasia shenzhenica TaxID=1088818 RepID=A0A2I0B176_9ASPA|nr:hypothetical protein AXF42_Ash018823 [Apostasia shenzhenica]